MNAEQPQENLVEGDGMVAELSDCSQTDLALVELGEPSRTRAVGHRALALLAIAMVDCCECV